MDLLGELKRLGVDVDDGLRRLMGNEELYRRLLVSFRGTMERLAVKADSSMNEADEMIERVHAVKGAAGNLSLTPIYEAYSRALELMRGGRIDEAGAVLKNAKRVTDDIMDCIGRYEKED